MELTAIIEALLLASEPPLTVEQLHENIQATVAQEEGKEVEDGAASWPDGLKNITEEDINKAILDLNKYYEGARRAFFITETSRGWKIYTHDEYAPFVAGLFPEQKPSRLSAPALETLAIVAYRQPLTKSAIDLIRGVSSDGMLQKLLEHNLIAITGRSELPGRPMLYGTTEHFFTHFGIRNIEDLPNSHELRNAILPEPEEEANVAEEPPLAKLTKK